MFVHHCTCKCATQQARTKKESRAFDGTLGSRRDGNWMERSAVGCGDDRACLWRCEVRCEQIIALFESLCIACAHSVASLLLLHTSTSHLVISCTGGMFSPIKYQLAPWLCDDGQLLEAPVISMLISLLLPYQAWCVTLRFVSFQDDEVCPLGFTVSYSRSKSCRTHASLPTNALAIEVQVLSLLPPLYFRSTAHQSAK